MKKCEKVLIAGMDEASEAYARILSKKGIPVAAICPDGEKIGKLLEEGVLYASSTEQDPALIQSSAAAVLAMTEKEEEEWIRDYGNLLPDHAWITDTGSASAKEAVQMNFLLEGSREFVPCRPLVKDGKVREIRVYHLPDETARGRTMAYAWAVELGAQEIRSEGKRIGEK